MRVSMLVWLHVSSYGLSFLADRSAPYRPCARKFHFWCFRSCDERLVGEALADRPIRERADAIHAVSFAAQAERELIHVALHMLDGEVVIDPVVAALQVRPYAFDAVHVRHAVNVLLGAVINRAVIVAVNARRIAECVSAQSIESSSTLDTMAS